MIFLNASNLDKDFYINLTLGEITNLKTRDLHHTIYERSFRENVACIILITCNYYDNIIN